jgi:hypothetical protein
VSCGASLHWLNEKARDEKVVSSFRCDGARVGQADGILKSISRREEDGNRSVLRHSPMDYAGPWKSGCVFLCGWSPGPRRNPCRGWLLPPIPESRFVMF